MNTDRLQQYMCRDGKLSPGSDQTGLPKEWLHLALSSIKDRNVVGICDPGITKRVVVNR